MMKSISLKLLKQSLSKYTEEAARGETIQITKHNKPFAYLLPAATPFLHAGAQVGRKPLRSIGKLASGGKYLKILKEDRDEPSG